jgi:hypothetical protein
MNMTKTALTFLLIATTQVGSTNLADQQSETGKVAVSMPPVQVSKEMPGSDRLWSRLQNHRMDDLRDIWLPAIQVYYLKERGGCLIKFSGQTNYTEVKIEKEMSLCDVLVKASWGHYDGQLRLVSRNAITQNSVMDWEHNEARKIQVHPGDLIFIQKRE